MPRSFAAAIVLALLVSAPLSAQSDSTPSISADTPIDRTQAFRKGQWAARFSITDGFYGIGALLFTSPRAAWGMNVDLRATREDQGSTIYTQQMVGVSFGRRWYGAERSRVRPLGGAGVRANYYRSATDYSGTETKYESYGGGVFGELGAAIFFAPELSLGATWGANIYATLNSENDDSYYSATVGYLSLEGAFYF